MLLLRKIFSRNEISDEASHLVAKAFSVKTWHSMYSAYKKLSEFCNTHKKSEQNCANKQFVEKLILWLLNENKISPNSVKSYLSSITSILKLKKIDHSHFQSYTTKIVLRGATNESNFTERPRRVMTIDLLTILGHEIACMHWNVDNKRVIWTACCVMFFGSLRIGEILSNSETKFDPKICLLWSDVKFENDSVLVHLKNTKTKIHGGEFIDFFRIENVTFCPWEALKGLKDSKTSRNMEGPVFCFSSGKLLTPSTFNSTIRSLLHKHIGHLSNEISSHSFRAGIPSALAKHPCKNTVTTIQNWGRWHSGCFKLYTRLHTDQRRKIHSQVCEILNCRPAPPAGGRGPCRLSL